MTRILSFLLAALIAASASGATRPYHLELEVRAAAPFPFLSRFGTVDLHVYPRGVRADALWLRAFSVAGSGVATVQNTVARLYTEIPVAQITPTIAALAGDPVSATPTLDAPVRGRVKGLDATRYRLRYGPEAWIDVWTSAALGENAQLRLVVTKLVAGISPETAAAADSIPGVPLYVELHFRRFAKVPIVTVKSLRFDGDDGTEGLAPGKVYLRVPLVEKLLRRD